MECVSVTTLRRWRLTFRAHVRLNVPLVTGEGESGPWWPRPLTREKQILQSQLYFLPADGSVLFLIAFCPHRSDLIHLYYPSSAHPAFVPCHRPPRLSSLALLFPVSWSPSALWSTGTFNFPSQIYAAVSKLFTFFHFPFHPLVLQVHLIVLVWLCWGGQGSFDWKMESFNSCSQRKKSRGKMSKVALFFLNLSLNSEDSVSWLQRELCQERPDVSKSSLVRRDLPKLMKNVQYITMLLTHVSRLWVRPRPLCVELLLSGWHFSFVPQSRQARRVKRWL